jgi:hypothetical protein
VRTVIGSAHGDDFSSSPSPTRPFAAPIASSWYTAAFSTTCTAAPAAARPTAAAARQLDEPARAMPRPVARIQLGADAGSLIARN